MAIKAYKDADLMLNNYHKESKIDEKTYTKFKARLDILPREWKVTVIVLMLSIRRRLNEDICEKICKFVKTDTVLVVSIVLAVISMLAVKPDRQYLTYIDFRTLAILFVL